MNMQLFMLTLFVLAWSLSAYAASNTDPIVYVIPGINGRGSEAHYVREILGNDSPMIIPVKNPDCAPDLGQSCCVTKFHEILKENELNVPTIIHATSQGAATALNYFAQVDKGKQIKALILEAPLVSGNSAIVHTLKGPLMNRPSLVKAPLSYYWLPYCAKIHFPWYSPSGEQPIKSISRLPNSFDTPIIIIHSKDDAQLCYDDSCALYYALRLKNKNVYLVTKEGRSHINLVKSDHDKAVIQAILNKHTLLVQQNLQEIDLSLYQPDPSLYKQKYDDLLSKEQRHVYLAYGLLLGCCALLIKPINALYKQLFRQAITST